MNRFSRIAGVALTVGALAAVAAPRAGAAVVTAQPTKAASSATFAPAGAPEHRPGHGGRRGRGTAPWGNNQSGGPMSGGWGPGSWGPEAGV